MNLINLAASLKTAFVTAFSPTPDRKLRESLDALDAVMIDRHEHQVTMETLLDELARR